MSGRVAEFNFFSNDKNLLFIIAIAIKARFWGNAVSFPRKKPESYVIIISFTL